MRKRGVWFAMSSLLLVQGWAKPVYAQFGTRNDAYRPSDRLGSFHGNLGSTSVSSLGPGAYGLLSPAASGSAGLPGSADYGTGQSLGVGGMPFGSGGLSLGPSPLGASYSRTLGRGGLMSPGALGLYSSVLPAMQPFAFQPGEVFLLPQGQKGDLCEEDLASCVISGQDTLRPIMPTELQTTDVTNTVPTEKLRPEVLEEMPSSGAAANTAGYLENGAMKTYRTGLFAARQMVVARGYIGQKLYEQALMSYEAAENLDSRSANPVVGTVFCLLMTGRYRASGGKVLRLARVSPEFWKEPVEYAAVFGVPREQILNSLSQIEGQIDDFIAAHDPTDPTARAQEHVMLAHLSKLYIAWLKQDPASIQQTIERASKASPFHREVQALYRKITGKDVGEGVELKDLSPVG